MDGHFGCIPPTDLGGQMAQKIEDTLYPWAATMAQYSDERP